MLNIWTAAITVLLFLAQGLPEPTSLGRSALDAKERYATIQFSMSTRIESSVDGKTEADTSMASVVYSKTDGIRFDNEDSIEISDGRTSWVYAKAGNQYRKFIGPLTKTSSGIQVASILAGLLPLDVTGWPQTLREEVVTLQGERHETWVVSGNNWVSGESGSVPWDPNARGALVPFTIWIDKAMGIVVKGTSEMTVTEKNGGESKETQMKLSWEIYSIKVDEPLANTLFTFTPPKGAKEVSHLGIDNSSESGRATGNAPSASASPSRYFRWETTPPSALSTVKPEYTPEAMQAGIEGIIYLSTMVHADGSVEVLGVTKGLGYGLDEKAIEQMKEIRYTPAMRDGMPIDFKMTVQFRYRLSPAQ